MSLSCMFRETPAGLASIAADLIATHIHSAINATGECLIAVAGGTTPVSTYRELSRLDIDWAKVIFVQTDERVTPQPTDRSAGLIETALGLTDPGHRATWSPIRVSGDGQETAAAYDNQLSRLRAEGVPDIAVLGLGTDGHTASIFDHTLGEAPYQRVVATTYHGEQRVSLGLNYLRAVPTRILLATGTGKRAALAEILNPATGTAPASAAVVLGQDGYVLADAAAHPGQA
ncbi:6-phosphogluconolactonase [Nocardia sp. CWNU-33]|uniref:6-phosphogluconolactonase n=1 Tax=Nocardia sp. CWNU-33 TaxID=3392117 RepID=UPI00398E89AA